MRKSCFIIFLSLLTLNIFAQLSSAEEYIKNYKDLAIREMKRMGVPAAITLAQGILETEAGNSDLVRRSNNHFGIKCKSTWSGGSVTHDDDEFGECFRKYNTAEDSYRDHSNFLRGNVRYAPLFELDPGDYKGWANGLKKAGYATNPAYPAILIRKIEKYNLHQYTLIALGEVPVFKSEEFIDEEPVVSVEPEAIMINEPADSKGHSKRNGLRSVYAMAGTSLLAIATDNNVDLDKLLGYNDLTADGLLKENAVIYLERKSSAGLRDYHFVTNGETLHGISQVHGIRLEALCILNDLQENDQPAAGTQLRLRPGVSEQSAPMMSVKSAVKTHEVQAKEGLYSISRKYNITIDELREWNSLSSDDLQIGQKLIVSKN